MSNNNTALQVVPGTNTTHFKYLAQTTTKTPTKAPTTPKEYKFFEPTVFEPVWDMSLACTECNYTLLNSKENLEDVANDKTKPIVFIPKPIYEDFMEFAKYAAKKKNSEAAMYFLYVPLDEIHPHWEICGWFPTGQKASAGEVEMVGSDFPRYRTYLEENYPELMKRAKIGHIHSHATMSK